MSKNQFELKTGVIGLGVMGQYHTKKLSTISNLVRVFDIDESLSSKTARLYDLQPCHDLDLFFQELDAVIIAVPTRYHLEFAKLAANSEVHTFIEKPLASNFEECLQIKSFFNQKKLKIGLGHIEDRNTYYQKQ